MKTLILEADYEEYYNELVMNQDKPDGKLEYSEFIEPGTKLDYYSAKIKSWCSATVREDLGGVLVVDYTVPQFIKLVDAHVERNVTQVQINKEYVRASRSRTQDMESSINQYYEYLRQYLTTNKY